MPTETDDNSKSLLLAGLGRQCMCFWTISRSVIYQIPAGGTKKVLLHYDVLLMNLKKIKRGVENNDNVEGINAI
jgi:hypothetical protein